MELERPVITWVLCLQQSGFDAIKISLDNRIPDPSFDWIDRSVLVLDLNPVQLVDQPNDFGLDLLPLEGQDLQVKVVHVRRLFHWMESENI
jgi:hypothetical protein